MGNTCNKILVSIIIPAYNVEKYIKECLESCLAQTHECTEIVVVDDGSFDRTAEILDEFAAPFSKVRIVHQKNAGQAAARNTGLSLAKGEYVIFCDSDDLMDPRMVETLLKICVSQEVDIASCCHRSFIKKDVENGSFHPMKRGAGKKILGIDFYNCHPSLSPCDKMFKISFLKKIRFQFSSGHFAEDAYDISFLILKANTVYHINDCLYFYRLDNELSTRHNSDISHVLRLCKDKLYISQKLYDLKRSNGYTGYINTIICRNILGATLNKTLKNDKRKYKELRVYAKEMQSRKIFLSCFTPGTACRMAKVIIRKIFKIED